MEELDTSKDEELRALPPESAIREICGWKLGDPEWYSIFARWCDAVGLEISREKS